MRHFSLLALAALAVFASTVQAVPFTAESTGTSRALGSPPVYRGEWTSAFTGTAPFGWIAADGNQMVDLVNNTITDGHLTITASNGDKLYGVFSGTTWRTADPTVWAVASTATFTGGTGGFTDASGTASYTGNLDVVHGTHALSWQGNVVVPEPASSMLLVPVGWLILARRKR